MDPWATTFSGFEARTYLEVEQTLEKHLAGRDLGRFRGVVGARFSNKPAAILRVIRRMLLTNIETKAVYLQMNGFDINPDRWYFDLFLYERFDSDVEPADWLGRYTSKMYPEVALRGMKRIQSAFAWYHQAQIYYVNPDFKPTYEAVQNLVMTKFVTLVREALHSGQLPRPVPVFAGAHGFEVLARFD